MGDPQHSAQISQKRHGCNIYGIMKTISPPDYHHNGFVATHAREHIMDSSCTQVHELPQSNCGDNLESTLFSSWLHIYITFNIIAHHFILLRLNPRVIGGGGVGLSTQCHSCRFACQPRVSEKIPGTGYFRFKDGIVNIKATTKI